MSVNYASGLSPYDNKGKCGMPEKFDSAEEVETKVQELANLLQSGKKMCVHTGAGISTSIGIPDFRGPKGVWTLEQKGESPTVNISFDTAVPSLTHMALVGLERAGYINYVVTQNIDGLHIRSGFPRNRLSELHGNMFVEECDKCGSQYINAQSVSTMGLKHTGNPCLNVKSRGKCRGRLTDTILDWEDSLPDTDLDLAIKYAKESDISLCLGTSLQIQPSAGIPMNTKKTGGKLVIVNLQGTKYDKKCNIRIFTYVDDVLKRLCEILDLEIPKFERPVVLLRSIHTKKDEKDKIVSFIKDKELEPDDIKDIQLLKSEKLKSEPTANDDGELLKNKKPSINSGKLKSEKLKRESADCPASNVHDDDDNRCVPLRTDKIKNELADSDNLEKKITEKDERTRNCNYENFGNDEKSTINISQNDTDDKSVAKSTIIKIHNDDDRLETILPLAASESDTSPRTISGSHASLSESNNVGGENGTPKHVSLEDERDNNDSHCLESETNFVYKNDNLDVTAKNSSQERKRTHGEKESDSEMLSKKLCEEGL